MPPPFTCIRKKNTMDLLKCGIPPQDLLASAIINHLPDVIAEIARAEPDAIWLSVTWDYLQENDVLAPSWLMVTEHDPALYLAYVNNVAEIPLDFQETAIVGYLDDDETGEPPALRRQAMMAGMHVGNMTRIPDKKTVDHLREVLDEFISQAAEDCDMFVNLVLKELDGEYNTDEALGWFFLDAMEIYTGRKIDHSWLIEHPKPTEDVV